MTAMQLLPTGGLHVRNPLTEPRRFGCYCIQK